MTAISPTIPQRPILRYHGGKWRLASWILSHFPEHRVYVEPYGGAGSLLLRKPRCYAEVYNDMDDEIVNLFRVVRDRGAALVRVLKLTPYCRSEYALSFQPSIDPIEQARRTVVRSYQGFGSNSLQRAVKSGFRAHSHRSGTTPARDWMNLPAAMEQIIERLRGVTIENREATAVMLHQDKADTLHYCDPTYLHSTRTQWAGRGARSGYAFEMSDHDHRKMAVVLRELKGRVVLSGYPSPLYDDELFPDWRRVERQAIADRAKPRTEVLWMNF